MVLRVLKLFQAYTESFNKDYQCNQSLIGYQYFNYTQLGLVFFRY